MGGRSPRAWPRAASPATAHTAAVAGDRTGLDATYTSPPPPSAEGERTAIIAALEAKLKAWGDDYIGGGLSRGTREQLNQEMHGLRTAFGIVEARKLGEA